MSTFSVVTTSVIGCNIFC